MMLNKKWTGSQEVSLSSTGFQIDNAVKTLTSLIQNGQSRLNYSNVHKILNLSKSKKKNQAMAAQSSWGHQSSRVSHYKAILSIEKIS